jgi:hypothetical protein
MNVYEGVELNLHSFLTTALDEVSCHASVPLLTEKKLLVPIEQEAGWTSDLVCTLWEKDKYVFLARNQITFPYSSSP